MLKLKKILSLVIAMVMVMGLGTTAFAGELKPEITIESYANYLEKLGDKETIDQFNNLSENDKSKLVEYLSSKEVMTQILDSMISNNNNVEMKNGDIQILNEKFEENESINLNRASEEYRKATYIKTVKMFGLSILESTAWIRYSHDGSSILEIQGKNFVISRNFNPLLYSSWSGKTSWKTKTTAYATADLTFSFIYEGLGIVIDTGEAMVSGNIYNETDGYVRGY